MFQFNFKYEQEPYILELGQYGQQHVCCNHIDRGQYENYMIVLAKIKSWAFTKLSPVNIKNMNKTLYFALRGFKLTDVLLENQYFSLHHREDTRLFWVEQTNCSANRAERRSCRWECSIQWAAVLSAMVTDAGSPLWQFKINQGIITPLCESYSQLSQ